MYSFIFGGGRNLCNSKINRGDRNICEKNLKMDFQHLEEPAVIRQSVKEDPKKAQLEKPAMIGLSICERKPSKHISAKAHGDWTIYL